LFTHPQVSLADGKMTRQWLKDAIDHNLDNDHGRSYLTHCWLPRNLFERWCEWNHLPKSPPRFRPLQESRGRALPEGAEGSPDSNKGGRPPAVDWEALKDAIVKEIKNHGYPEGQNPPGWRGTKDVADFIEDTFPKEVKKVSRRTIEDNVRRIIRELKATSTGKPVSR